MIDLAFSRSRTIMLLLLFILIAGGFSYRSIPKESEPDIAVPIIYVSMNHEGISPEDAERLLVRPMEKELQGIEGVKEMSSTAREHKEINFIRIPEPPALRTYAPEGREF